ncbi:MAG: hypothetical protein DSZ06_03130 [Sulfurospirillum sp.]|nr:MAG: hypothetical protein DSZ06_03130 [Sulfurospirillum sp.]
MKIFLALIVIIASLAGVSFYKNSLIEKELSKELRQNPKFAYSNLECSGFLKSDCKIKDPKIRSIELAKSITIKGIDPLNIPNEDEKKQIPVSIFVEGAKFSLWDFVVRKKSALNLKEFYKKHSGDYNISSDLILNVNQGKVEGLKLLSLKAKDRFLPYELSGELDGLDSALIVKKLHFNLDLSQKRALFDDFALSMRECCSDQFPKEYQNKSNDELYEEFKAQLNQYQTTSKSIKEIVSALADENKKDLKFSADAKSSTPVKNMILSILILGPKALDKFYDIKVNAK